MLDINVDSGADLYFGREPPIVNQSILLSGADGLNKTDNFRVKFPTLTGTEAPFTSTPINVGATPWVIRFRINASATNNASALGASPAYSDIVLRNILVDNDKWQSQSGYEGGWVLVLAAGVLYFGLLASGAELVISGGGDIRALDWVEVAIQYNPTTGRMSLYLNGTRVATGIGPAVNTSLITSPTYPSTCGLSGDLPCGFSFPYITFGNEKHDYPGTLGTDALISDIEFSDTDRYGTSYTPATSRIQIVNDTIALFPCTENGHIVTDVVGGGLSTGFITNSGSPNFTPDLARSMSNPYG